MTEITSKPMQTVTKRLRDTHPSSKKVAELFETADQLGLSFTVMDGFLIINDRDFPHEIQLLSADTSLEESDVYTLPPMFEYKLTFTEGAE